MSRPRRPSKKKTFTVHEANATLPLVRAIVRDITELAGQYREAFTRVEQLRVDDPNNSAKLKSELDTLEEQLKADRAKMEEYEDELLALGVELKDYFMGLVDFPHLRDGREVYLCWRLGEPDVAYWHEKDTGFGGRQPLAKSLSHT